MTKNFEHRPFHSSKEEYSQLKPNPDASPCYKLAFSDLDFLLREELRPVRVQLELWKPEAILHEHGVVQTIVIFGSARIPEVAAAEAALKTALSAAAQSPTDAALQKAVKRCEQILANSRVLIEATKLATIVSECKERDFFVVTGGGPSFMAAANKGAMLANKASVALGVLLPHEQVPNEFVTPELTFQFHYFAIRKMHFLIRAKALIAFPGGFGTMDELFECLTLLQTKKIEPLPLVLFRKEFWDRIVNFEELVEQGVIAEQDLKLIHFAETAEEAWDVIRTFHKLI